MSERLLFLQVLGWFTDSDFCSIIQCSYSGRLFLIPGPGASTVREISLQVAAPHERVVYSYLRTSNGRTRMARQETRAAVSMARSTGPTIRDTITGASISNDAPKNTLPLMATPLAAS